MFGLKAFFTALARLTASINQSADLFDEANQKLVEQIGVGTVENGEPEQLSYEAESNGKAKRRQTAK